MMAHRYPSIFATATTRQVWSVEKGAERPNRKPNNIKGSPGISDRETSTCSVCHSLVPSLSFSSLGLSYLNEGKEYRASITTVKRWNRRRCTLGWTVRVGTLRYLYEWASTPKSSTHGILWLLPVRIGRIHSRRERLVIKTEPSLGGTRQGRFKHSSGILGYGNYVMAVSHQMWRAGTSKRTIIDLRGQYQRH